MFTVSGPVLGQCQTDKQLTVKGKDRESRTPLE